MSIIRVSLLTATVVLFLGFNGSMASRRRCPDNRITRQQFLDFIATSTNFLSVYTIHINSPDMFGKTITRWEVSNDADTFTYVRNLDQNRCDEFINFNSSIVEKREFRKSKCCQKRGRPVSDDFIILDAAGERQQRFISQEPSTYFWWLDCFNGTVRTMNTCQLGYFELQIADIRTTTEIDLSGLPWDKIAEDLKDFTGRNLDDSEVRYIWLGTGEEHFSFSRYKPVTELFG